MQAAEVGDQRADQVDGQQRRRRDVQLAGELPGPFTHAGIGIGIGIGIVDVGAGWRRPDGTRQPML